MWGHVTKWKLNISPSTRPMITKLCRVVTYDEGNLLIMPTRDSVTTKSCEVMWQTKNKISPLPQCLWPLNLAACLFVIKLDMTNKKQNVSSSARSMATKLGWVVIYDEGKPCMKSHDPLITWSRDKLKIKYFLFYKSYGHQETCQGGDLWWGSPSHEVAWTSNYVSTWGYVTNWRQNIFPSASPTANKLGRATTYGKGNPHMHWHDSLITCSHQVM